ncbi:hypothetical protein CLAFUW4_13624 [Fulvia fulva]|uniref:Uncharacterized protein n=1 Tax=Passalora fulva TaxID=5499 RepID=A0A9Q8PL74_PASFU|nr:uncharacterized protein CLAFUR5_13476 [Fulvia fulva]KAK4610641.1 hypothetical protein CLAFUR4_13627 [Fulvia fulva]KAK4610935.1 hypothetical protein CLAFUR0_13631 [Fulvia fulva]UJO24555.1 hypothetical protein CLAFUR5_13476 [Fulvia fulva]WPV22300.1 hypothetical protein CLAFUW4_13624 [Fulvia fulva]WPV36735.1 hypothetical protein CLAFUW7_13632 [Fulvia fulva]
MIRNEAVLLYLKHIRKLKKDAAAKEDAAAEKVETYLRDASADSSKFDFREVEKLVKEHDALLQLCLELQEIMDAEEVKAAL